jgi:hypothetical protein
VLLFISLYYRVYQRLTCMVASSACPQPHLWQVHAEGYGAWHQRLSPPSHTWPRRLRLDKQPPRWNNIDGMDSCHWQQAQGRMQAQEAQPGYGQPEGPPPLVSVAQPFEEEGVVMPWSPFTNVGVLLSSSCRDQVVREKPT